MGAGEVGRSERLPGLGLDVERPGRAVALVVQEESAAGLPGFVNLIGIESPGLTAALAIGEEVVALLRGL